MFSSTLGKLARTFGASQWAGYGKGLRNLFAFQTMKRLLAHNGVEGIESSSDFFHWVNTQLFAAAVASYKEQQAKGQLPAGCFEYHKDLYFLGARVMSIAVALPFATDSATGTIRIDNNRLRDFADGSGDRSTFDFTSNFGMAFPANERNSDDVTVLRNLIRDKLHQNYHKLGEAIEQHSKNIGVEWHDEDTFEQNIVRFLFTVLFESVFEVDVDKLPKDLFNRLYNCINRFEALWLEPEAFSKADYDQLAVDLKAISQEILMARPETENENGILTKLVEFLEKRSSGVASVADLNIAFFTTLFSNLPKALIGAAYCVLWQDDIVSQLRAEHGKIPSNRESRDEKVDWLLKKSEYYNRVLLEVLRFWPVVGDQFRAPVNIFGGPSSSADANLYARLSGRTLVVYPMSSAADYVLQQNNDENSDIEEFNPSRPGLVAKGDFGFESPVNPFSAGARACPGKDLVRRILAETLYAIVDDPQPTHLAAQTQSPAEEKSETKQEPAPLSQLRAKGTVTQVAVTQAAATMFGSRNRPHIASFENAAKLTGHTFVATQKST